MPTSITQPDKYIECLDNNGTRKNLSIKSWSLITGKSAGTIRYHYDRKRSGKIEITNRQICGLDCYQWKNPGRPVKRRPPIKDMLTEFNRTGRVRAVVARG